MRNRILFGLSLVLLVVLIVFGGMTIAKSLTQSTAAKPQQTESQETEQVKKPKFLKNYSAVELTKYYPYGTHLSLEGSLSVEGTVKNVFLLMVPSESTGPSDYTQRQILNYDSTTGVFQTAKELNEGLCLEGFEDNNYYLMLSVVYGDGSVDYYRVKDASGEEPLVYYTLTDTATGTNQKIEMGQEEDTAMLSITTTELPADVYDIVIDPGHGGNDAGTVSGEEEDLLRILTEPKNALVKQYQKLMSFDDIELEFTEDALKHIAKLALERKIGARGLRAIIEKCMEKVMFDIPDVKDAKKVVVNADVVDGKSEAIVYGKSNKKIA